MNKNKKACPSGLPAGRQEGEVTIIEILVIVAIIASCFYYIGQYACSKEKRRTIPLLLPLKA